MVKGAKEGGKRRHWLYKGYSPCAWGDRGNLFNFVGRSHHACCCWDTEGGIRVRIFQQSEHGILISLVFFTTVLSYATVCSFHKYLLTGQRTKQVMIPVLNECIF